jgi:hypothetical protein
MNKISLLTAIFGGFDEVPPKPDGFDEYILVSDVPIKSDWQNVVLGQGGDPRLSSKVPKFRPDLFVSHQSSVWMDASLRDPKKWLAKASTQLLENFDIGLFRHPDRSTVAEEVGLSLSLFKYHKMPLMAQLQRYTDSGFRDEGGLWACGVIARNHNDLNRRLGDRWLIENICWSTQDQISLPFLLEQLNIVPGSFEEGLWTGPLQWHGHKHDDYSFPNKGISWIDLFLKKFRSV